MAHIAGPFGPLVMITNNFRAAESSVTMAIFLKSQSGFFVFFRQRCFSKQSVNLNEQNLIMIAPEVKLNDVGVANV